MRTFICLFLLVSVSAYAWAKKQPLNAQCEEEVVKMENEENEEEPDLFRRNAQIYSGHIEFLFWRLQEGALEYAQKMSHPGWGPTECFAEGKYKNATFNGDPGFRLSLIYFRAPHFWEYWMQYARFTTRGSNSSGKPKSSSEFLTGTYPQIFTAPIAKAKSYIHVNYNLADLLVTRVFIPNPHLRLRAVGGAAVTWMDQFWKILYRDSVGDHTKIANSWRYIGAGLKVGTIFDWYWTWDLYLTGTQSFAGFLGSYHNDSRQTTNFTPGPGFNPDLPIRSTHYSDIRAAFETQFSIGPSYQKNLSDSRFEFFVGWEVTAWFNLQETYHSTSGSPSEAKEPWINTSLLALQGLTVRAIYDF